MQIDVPGVIIGGIVGWLIARHYYKRSAADLTEELRRSAAEAERKDTLAYFELMLERSIWTAETIREQERVDLRSAEHFQDRPERRLPRV